MHNDHDDKISLPLLTRRKFLEGSAASAAALTLLPRSARAAAAAPVPDGQTIKLGCIGVGAQGTRVMMDFLKIPDVQVVAVCDVNRETSDYSEWGKDEIVNKERKLLNDPSWGSDWKGATCGRAPAARLVDAYYRNVRQLANYRACGSYNDFRDLIAKEHDLDGVVVCTPDHWHAYIAIYALRHGKHVFSQKPMAHTVHECALMAKAARETGLATQVAVMNEASDATRHLTEWVAAGVIGQIREVHNWSQRPYWPQGMERPKGVAARARRPRLGPVAGSGARAAVQPCLPAVCVARLERFRRGLDRRHGQLQFRHDVPRAQTDGAHQRRGQFNAALPGDVSAGRTGALGISRTRQPCAGHHPLV